MNNLKLRPSGGARVLNFAMSLAAIFAVSLALGANNAADARGFHARGSKGAAGGYARQGQYGRSAGAAAVGYNRGAGFRAGSWNGPNGGSLQSAGGGAYKRGVGAMRASKFASTGPNGGSASGYSNNVYNAQTGTGVRNSGKDINTASGQSYGYDSSTSYTKGQGATSTIDTQNKGDYSIDWQKGSKPVVTPSP